MRALPRHLLGDLAERGLKPDDIVFAPTGATIGNNFHIGEYSENAVFARKKHLDYGDLFESLFINCGAKALMPMFSEVEPISFIEIIGSREKELFVEA